MPSLETYESPRSRLLARLGVRGPQEMRLVGPASAHPDHALRPHLEAARRVRQPRGEEDVHLPRKGQAAAAALLREGCGAGVRRVRRQRRRLCRRRPLVAREEETRVDGARPKRRVRQLMVSGAARRRACCRSGELRQERPRAGTRKESPPPLKHASASAAETEAAAGVSSGLSVTWPARSEEHTLNSSHLHRSRIPSSA